MKNKLRYVDGLMLVLLLLWLSSTDFDAMTWDSWLAGGAVTGYLVFNGVRRYRSEGKQKNEPRSKPEKKKRKPGRR